MRLFFLLLALAPIIFSESNKCNKKTDSKECLKGRLEIKGICSNYIITIINGDYDTSKVETAWTHPESGKQYQNVFKLGTPCSFPFSLNEGDEFYFEFVQESKEDCAVCMAYSPVPEKINLIRVLNSPCSGKDQ